MMTTINRYLLVATLSMMSFHAQGAGFNCAKASTPIEKTICADAKLSDLDGFLRVAYKEALSNTSNPTALKAEQQKWLKSVRNTCPLGTDCLNQVYTARLTELEFLSHATEKLPAISSEYQRKPDKTASISVQDLNTGQFHITGNATWVGNAETGNVNTGELDGTFPLNGNTLHYSSGDNEFDCKLTLTFAKKSLTVTNDNGNCGGHNVSFNGEYYQVSKKNH